MEMVHPFFPSFKRWSGPSDGRFHIDFLGVKTLPGFMPGLAPSAAGTIEGEVPAPGPDIFAWISTVGTARNAKGRFVMAQIGGGCGAWLIRCGVTAARMPKVPCHLIGVEADEERCQAMREHFSQNGFDPGEHTLMCGRLKGGSGSGGKVITLEALFNGLETIDVLYLDLQPGEQEALKSDLKTLNRKVRRVCIRTHAENADRELEQLFNKADWLPRWIYHTNSTWATYWGLMEFPSGCQVWLNKALLG